MDLAKLRRRIFIRTIAKELLTFIPDLLSENNIKPEEEDTFWEVLAEEACYEVAKVPLSQKRHPVMNYEESVSFENEVVPYGSYKGLKVRDVPISYWIRLTEGNFSKKLFKYVRSQRFLERQHDPSQEDYDPID